ncbi:MAG: diaminopimelate epimerase [Bacteroidales bacterium]|nr:diaminopimelate epimerase [Bacteroidales bacterium]
MANIPFYKFHGTGNDFILIDQRAENYHLTTEKIQQLCHRHIGIGADGLIALQNAESVDFEMKFWNSDGSNSMMCGNGGRCIVALANMLKIFEQQCTFLAPDGIHHASIEEDYNHIKTIALSMHQSELPIPYNKDSFFVHTGTPHFVVFVSEIFDIDVVPKGRQLRYDERFAPQGINVDFVKVMATNHLYVRTYERGVEDETLSCGTGVTAAALAYVSQQHTISPLTTIKVETPGGSLLVKIDNTDSIHPSLQLIGPAVCLYQGIYNE